MLWVDFPLYYTLCFATVKCNISLLLHYNSTEYKVFKQKIQGELKIVCKVVLAQQALHIRHNPLFIRYFSVFSIQKASLLSVYIVSLQYQYSVLSNPQLAKLTDCSHLSDTRRLGKTFCFCCGIFQQDDFVRGSPHIIQ